MDSATCVGSSASSGKGFPLAVLQNLQHRVQIFPPIMKVAVPFQLAGLENNIYAQVALVMLIGLLDVYKRQEPTLVPH